MVDAYTLVFAGLLLTAGSLGDRFGRKGALTVGLVIFGGARRRPRSPAASTQLDRRPRGHGHRRRADHAGDAVDHHQRVHRRRVSARSRSASGRASPGSAVALGPVTGGFLLEHFWWGSVFIVNVPIVIAAIVAGHFLVPDVARPGAPPLDSVGAGLSIVGLGLARGRHHRGAEQRLDRPADPRRLRGRGASRSARFVCVGAAHRRPMLDVRFFRQPPLHRREPHVTLVFFALFGFMFLATQYLQFVLGYSRVRGRVAHAAVRVRA